MYSTFEHARVQKIFVMAHKLAHDATIGDRERKYFMAIAYELWRGFGRT